MAHSARVALLIESSRCVGREILTGVANYVRTRTQWTVFQHERTLHDPAPARLAAWKPDGIIARIGSPTLIRQIKRLGVPTVDVLGWHPVRGVPRFGNDRQRVVETAVEHLRQRGLTEFAYCGFSGMEFSEVRGALFAREVARLGSPMHAYRETSRSGGRLATYEAERQLQVSRVAAWLTSLPKPVGLFACNDMCARQVLAACHNAGVLVPDAVAVLGVDNDQLLCELSDPPLSSVQLDNEMIGYEAARLLDRMLAGERPEREEFRFPPRIVVARRSTETLAVTEPGVAESLRLIREQACQGVTVGDVLRQADMSPSSLKRRFAAILGRSPKAEIQRVQLDRAKALLVDGNLPLDEVASLAGFASAQWFCKLFHRKTGCTPGQYRRTMNAQSERR